MLKKFEKITIRWITLDSPPINLEQRNSYFVVAHARLGVHHMTRDSFLYAVILCLYMLMPVMPAQDLVKGSSLA